MVEVNKMGKDFKCNECLKILTSKDNLKKHINEVHLKLKPFKCTQCNRQFSQKINMQKHINQTHNDIRPYICPKENCGSSFKRDYHLTNHIKQIHDNIRDKKCEYCDYICATKVNLLNHTRQVHYNFRPYKCTWENCKSTFKRSYHLTNHITQMHTKEKDYICYDCGYECSTKVNIIHHQRIYCRKGVEYKKRMSSGEIRVELILKKYGIDYTYDENYDGLKSYKNKGYLRFDFKNE